MIISFCGNAGSGKTTAAKMLAEKLGWKHYYIGGLRRLKAKERGLTLEEYNKLGETDPSTDLEVDEYQRELGQALDNFVIEGRTSWHFIPHSFKIFLDVDEKIGAERILNELKQANERNETNKKIETVEEMVKLNQKRKASDTLRYQQYFGINAYDQSNFDFIVDTTDLSPEQTFEKIYQKVQSELKRVDK